VAADFLLHHLRRAGARPGAVIADEVLELLARATGGVPRLLNQAARQALALAAEGGTPFVDVEAALDALTRLGLEAPDEASGELCPEGEPILVGPDGPDPDPPAADDEDRDDPSCRLYVAPRRPA
jgi:hypothetical protein